MPVLENCLEIEGKSFRERRDRCWQLWEHCFKETNSRDYSSLRRLQQDTFEFLDYLVTLTLLVENLEERNRLLITRVSDLLRNLLSLRRQKSKLEAKIARFIESKQGSHVQSLKIQPAWNLLDPLKVEEVYGPRIAGLVTRTQQIEIQASKLETLRKFSAIEWLGRHLKGSQLCMHFHLHQKQSTLRNLANILYCSREILLSRGSQLLENIHLKLGFKKKNMPSIENSSTESDLDTFSTFLFFDVNENECRWNVSIEEVVSSELLLKDSSFCSYGILSYISDSSLLQIQVEPEIPQENIKNLQHFLLELLRKDAGERTFLVISELLGFFVTNKN
jgi:hypothetical protein